MPVPGLQPGAIISIPVRDLEKSIAWYRETFGFEVVRTLEEPAWCELATTTAEVRIGPAQVYGGDPGDTTPIFTAGCVETAAAALAAGRAAHAATIANARRPGPRVASRCPYDPECALANLSWFQVRPEPFQVTRPARVRKE